MPLRQTLPLLLPALWLLSDARNDASLESTLLCLPRGSGFIFRHYHLGEAERRARFRELARVAARRGHCIVLSGDAATAREWGAHGVYGPVGRFARAHGLLRLATAHSLREIGRANSSLADAVVLSPAFPTRSHPGGKPLGPLRFRLLAAHAQIPVIALGGMASRTANRLDWPRWAAIDGLS